MSIFNRKKKQSTEDRFLELFTKALDTANENAQVQVPVLLKNQNVWEPNYGLDKTNPIISESLQSTTDYLRRLCTSDGKTFTWSGHTSIRAAVHGLPDVGVDQYTLYLDGQPYTNIYFVPYVGRAEFPPAGLYFSDDKRDWDEERLIAQNVNLLGFDRETAKRMAALDPKRKKKQEAEREISASYPAANLDEHLIAKRADEWGVTKDVARQLIEADIIRSEKENTKKKEAERKIALSYPAVNIDIELKNPLFKSLYDLDLDAVLIYEYVHSSQLFARKNQYLSRDKIRVPNVDYYRQILLGIYHDELEKINDFYNQDEVAGAKELGVSLGVYRSLQSADYARLKENWKKREAKIAEMARQAVELKKKYPGFDIKVDAQNRIFKKLIDVVSLQEAFEIIHFSDCFEKTINETPSVSVARPGKPAETNISKLEEKRIINEKLFCRNCGKQIPLDSSFCSYCGTKVIR